MKKIFALAVAVASMFTMQAQDLKATYEQAKKLDDAFSKVNPAQMDAQTAKGLMDAIDLYEQIMKAEQESGGKPKFTEKIAKSMQKHTMNQDFNTAAVALFNGNMRYPEAYNAFMMSGMMSQQAGVPDTIYAVDFYNAGNSAYGTDFPAAIVAYDAAIEANTNEPEAFTYAIGARQNVITQQPEKAEQLNQEIHDIAGKGMERYGYDRDFLLSNYLQYYFDKNDFDSALKVLETAEAQNPNNANIYRLRGIISNAQHKYMDAVPSFIKMSELTDNFDYMFKAANDLNSIGKAVMGNIATPTPEVKQQIIDIFNAALKIAQKALNAPDANADRVNYLIEDINYGLGNANKL